MSFILIAQLAMAVLLVATDVFDMFPGVLKEIPAMPTGPVTPGDQRREYRTDRPVPDLVQLEGPVDLPMPEEFSERLTFIEQSVEGFGNILLLTGGIEPGDAGRFETYLAEMDAPPDLVALHSPGGVVSEAQTIGRIVRQEALSTAVLASANCVSSCPYILAGGEDRVVSRRGIVGMHQHYYEQPRYIPVILAVEDIQASQGETMEFLIEMGVDPSLMIYSLKTPPEQIYALVEDELEQTMIATEIIE